MNKLKLFMITALGFLATSPAFAAAAAYADAADLEATVTGLTTLVTAIGGAAIVLALTRMVLRKVRGFAGRAG